MQSLLVLVKSVESPESPYCFSQRTYTVWVSAFPNCQRTYTVWVSAFPNSSTHVHRMGVGISKLVNARTSYGCRHFQTRQRTYTVWVSAFPNSCFHTCVRIERVFNCMNVASQGPNSVIVCILIIIVYIIVFSRSKSIFKVHPFSGVFSFQKYS